MMALLAGFNARRHRRAHFMACFFMTDRNARAVWIDRKLGS